VQNSDAKPYHFYATPALNVIFDAFAAPVAPAPEAPAAALEAPALAPILPYIKPKFLKEIKVNVQSAILFSDSV
jgi:hypothetical protein